MTNTEVFSADEFKVLEKRKEEKKITPEEFDAFTKLSKEKIAKYKEIEESMASLQWASTLTIEELLDEKIKIMKEILSNSTEGTVVGKIKDKAETAVNTVQKKAKEEWMKVIESKIPWAWKFFWSFEKLWKIWEKVSAAFDKWIMPGISAIIAWIWVLLWKWKLWGKAAEAAEIPKGWEDWKWNERTTAITLNWEKNLQNTQIPAIDIAKDSKEDLFSNLRLKWGFRLLTTLSWKEVDNNYWTNFIEEWFIDNNITYEELIMNWDATDFKKKILNKNNKEEDVSQYNKFRESLISDNVQDLLRIWLTGEVLSIILIWRKWNKENIKLKEILWEDRFNEILEMSKAGDFDYKKLRVHELATLYTYTIPIFTNGALLWVTSGFSDGVSKLMWISKDILWWVDNEIFSKKLLWRIARLDWSKLMESKDSLLWELNLTEEKDKEDFENLYDFKEYVLWESWLFDTPKLFLWVNPEYKALLQKNMNYKWVLALYWTMWWKHLEELNPINIPIVALLLHKIIWKGQLMNSFTASNYMVDFTKKYFLPKDWEEIITPDEKRIIEIYGESFIDIYIVSRMKGLLSKVWLAVDKDSLIKAWAISTWVWLTLNFTSNKITKKALAAGKLPFFMRPLKLAWWTWIIWWIALWGLWILESTEEWIQKYDVDLEKARKEKNLNKIITLMDKYEESILDFERENKAWEKIRGSLNSYNNEAPYIVFDNKIYYIALTTPDNDLWSRLLEQFGIEKDPEWKIRFENWKLYIWTASLDIESLLVWKWEEKEKGEGFLDRTSILVNDTVKLFSSEYRFNTDWVKTQNYIQIWKFKDFDISLISLWEIE